jgi:hypothetical protein
VATIAPTWPPRLSLSTASAPPPPPATAAVEAAATTAAATAVAWEAGPSATTITRDAARATCDGFSTRHLRHHFVPTDDGPDIPSINAHTLARLIASLVLSRRVLQRSWRSAQGEGSCSCTKRIRTQTCCSVPSLQGRSLALVRSLSPPHPPTHPPTYPLSHILPHVVRIFTSLSPLTPFLLLSYIIPPAFSVSVMKASCCRLAPPPWLHPPSLSLSLTYKLTITHTHHHPPTSMCQSRQLRPITTTRDYWSDTKLGRL